MNEQHRSLLIKIFHSLEKNFEKLGREGRKDTAEIDDSKQNIILSLLSVLRQEAIENKKNDEVKIFISNRLEQIKNRDLDVQWSAAYADMTWVIEEIKS